MAKTPPAPELTEVYQLIKAGQRQDAGRILKDYLAQHKDDPQAWWLMSHAVTKPDAIRQCLETVLRLDPAHEQARARLAKVPSEGGSQTAPPQASAPQVAPSRARLPGLSGDDFPDDAMILRGAGTPPAPGRAPQTASSPVAATSPAEPAGSATSPAARAVPPSFEEFLAADSPGDPFAGPPVDDPFADIAAPDPFASRPPADDPFAPKPASGAYNPFDSANIFDPAAHARLGASNAAQAPGSGNQPDWGPGLAFVSDNTAPAAIANAARPAPPRPQTRAPVGDTVASLRRLGMPRGMVVILAGLGIIAVIAVLLSLADALGLVSFGGGVPAMTTMEARSFTMKYPKGWDMRCATDVSGYPVCGIANHQFYNEVDYFTGTDIDLGAMFSTALSAALSGEHLPEEQVSIIVMDVPRSSPSYDGASWAKTLWEGHQNGWNFDDDARVDYDFQVMTLDGLTAYYYHYISQGDWTHTAWDVYVEHDGIVLWLRIEYWHPHRRTPPDKTVEAIIQSINIKPVAEW
jgi:hypothetical protein